MPHSQDTPSKGRKTLYTPIWATIIEIRVRGKANESKDIDKAGMLTRLEETTLPIGHRARKKGIRYG